MKGSEELSDALRLLPLTEAADQLARGSVTSVSLTEACLTAAERVQSELNAFIEIRADQAMRQAEDADRRRANGDVVGPLQGIPLAHKDVFYRPGEITTAGSAYLANFRPQQKAKVLEHLDAAGAVDIGTLNLAEFCVGPTGQNDHTGDCKNPWNPSHITGGSSSGSGAAVGACAIFASLGSDTGGSIRLPAGICGVVGLKPSRGLVSLSGGVERCWSLDVFGPLARTVEDVALMLGAIAGYDQTDHHSRSITIPDYHAACRARTDTAPIAVPVGLFDMLDGDIAERHREALEELCAAGFRLNEVELPETASLYQQTTVINNVEATFLHQDNLEKEPIRYNPSTLWRINRGYDVSALDYLAAIRGQEIARERFSASLLKEHSAIYLPLLETDVPTIEDVKFSDTQGADRIVPRLTRWTRWISYLGLPSLTLPIGFAASGLPVACQLLGGMYRETTLLQIGHAFQSRTRWHEEHPAIARSPR